MHLEKATSEINNNDNHELNSTKFDPNKMIPEVSDGKNKTERVRDIITRNEALVDDVHPITGVSFKRKIIELPSGEKIEGVFPEFESEFDAKIEESDYEKSDKEQFKECNKQLYEKLQNDPEFKKKMVEKYGEEFVEQVKEGCETGAAPDGFVWHHNEEPGKMQLVDAKTHAATGHTGGRSIWGGGTENR